MRTFERTCKKCPDIFLATSPGNTVCPACQPAPEIPKPCAHCEAVFERRTGPQKYCEDCCPIGNLRARQLLTNYKINLFMFDAMYFEQDGTCPICSLWEATVVDHDHRCCPTYKSCGRCVRGLLCVGCNINISRWENTPDANLLTLPYPAVAYLFSNRRRHSQ